MEVYVIAKCVICDVRDSGVQPDNDDKVSYQALGPINLSDVHCYSLNTVG